jgi:hypothetical protein
MIRSVAGRARKGALRYNAAVFVAGNLANEVGHGHFDV